MFQRRKKTEPTLETEPKPVISDDWKAEMPTLNEKTQGDLDMNAGASVLEPQDLQPSSPAPKSGQGALLGRGARFEGKLTFEGTVEIQGEVYGEISSSGQLVVAKDAKIEAQLGSLHHISGHLKGNVKTTGTLELRSTAHVIGEIEVDSLTVKGAFFQGQVTMTN